MMADQIWVNGSRSDTPTVSARDRGLTLGDGVFETMRVAHGCIFRQDAHLTRLERGLSRLTIPIPGALRAWLAAALVGGGLADGRARLTVTRGIGPTGMMPPPQVEPTVIIDIGPRPAVPSTVYSAGLSAHLASGRRNERAFGAGIKTVGYTEAILALQEARSHGADEALFLDTVGNCAEATASNLFIVRRGRLQTPPLSCGILPGVTRDVTLELAASIGLAVAHTPFGIDELRGADEAFLTSSLRGIAPLVRLSGRAIGTGAPGAVTRELMGRYEALIERECTAARS